ncbi:MAG: dihydrolipoamide acetyltransferase family protein [Candidatus Hodarchaeales archaeon]|jgi:pyruvate dehydrogenase E2 component (dihydrolipoamide acetyltransferase)
MVFELKFADVGEGVHEGEILSWHIQVGDKVEIDQLLVEVMTEKVNVEITAPVAGKIISLGKKEGDIIKVGEILISIEENEIKGYPKYDEPPKKTTFDEREKDDSLFTPSQPFKRIQQRRNDNKTVNNRVLASPAIRREAREKGIDLSKVTGTGLGGRITRPDFDEFLKEISRSSTSLKPKMSLISSTEERIPLRGLRRVISQTMRKSKDTAAHYSYFEEVDMSALDKLRQSAKIMGEKRGIKITYLPLIIKCLIPALKEFPFMNATLDDETQEIIVKHYFNIGIAVATEQGLVVPVVKNADQKTIWELAVEINDLANKARDGKLSLEDLQGGSFTLTSIGNIGGVMATPIINYPEVAILAIMKKKLRPVVIEENGKPEIAIRPMMFLSLSLDHRVIDGAIGAYFMNTLIKYMDNPSLLLLDE